MRQMKAQKNKAKIYKASLELQQRIGKGPLDPKLVAKAQKAIEENKVDFTPLGLQFLNELEQAINDVSGNLTPEKVIEQKKMLTDPVMELKANATIFHYSLVGNLAGVMLSFLESIRELDEDAIAIVRAHHDTLKAIIAKRMSGDGGEHGQVLMLELKDACARYYRKKKAK
ncbi:MAG: hypothetical protein MRY79_06235 [Alphaproteobacteria bacterium]|nr:hypothetical protein [Alphaproteobacteria bacterium]